VWPKMDAPWRGTAVSGEGIFPLLTKFIFTAEKLSVQVHPDDDYAAEHEAAAGGRGKTEMWYAMRAAPGAEVLAGLKPGALVVEMSSGVPATTQALAEDVGRAGGVLIDAPVSGGVARAVTGDLAIMVGGPDDAVARARPVLEAMGTSILPTGAVGTAHAMKALNNLVSATGLLISVEALLIGKRFGLDPEMMVDVLNASTGMNNSTQKKLKPFVLSRRFDSGFGLELMVKDLAIALGIAQDGAVSAPLSSLSRELWAAALAMDVGPDHTAIARYSEHLAGLEL